MALVPRGGLAPRQTTRFFQKNRVSLLLTASFCEVPVPFLVRYPNPSKSYLLEYLRCVRPVPVG